MILETRRTEILARLTGRLDIKPSGPVGNLVLAPIVMPTVALEQTLRTPKHDKVAVTVAATGWQILQTVPEGKRRTYYYGIAAQSSGTLALNYVGVNPPGVALSNSYQYKTLSGAEAAFAFEHGLSLDSGFSIAVYVTMTLTGVEVAYLYYEEENLG